MAIPLKRLCCGLLAAVYLLTVFSCAGVQAPQPKVMLAPDQYPNSKTFEGISVAVLPFDPNRDFYAAPTNPRPRKPDFNWFKAGVCPTRIILANNSQMAVIVDPAQITCIDAAGTPYQAYNVKEAGDAVVASEAFGSYVRGAIAGAILGAVITAGLGAAIGGAAGGGSWAARGAAIGAAYGGTEGLFLGSVANRAQMEARVRTLIMSSQLRPMVVSPGMTHDGLVYFPAVQIQTVRLIMPDFSRQSSLELVVPVVMPRQEVAPPAPAPAPAEETPASPPAKEGSQPAP